MKTGLSAVIGLNETIQKLREYPDKIKKGGIRRGLKEITKRVRDDARRLVPVDTGELKKHIVAVPSRSKEKHIVAAAVIVKKSRKISAKTFEKLKGKRGVVPTKKGGKIDVYYAPFVEYGTRVKAAKPYMRPAVEKSKLYMDEIMQAEIDKDMKEHFG